MLEYPSTFHSIQSQTIPILINLVSSIQASPAPGPVEAEQAEGNVGEEADAAPVAPAFPVGRWHLKAIMGRAREANPMDAWDGNTPDDCLLRVRALQPQIKEFVDKVRVEEGFVSQGQVSGGAGLEPGTHNYIQHRIAMDNYKHNIQSIRISRHAAWRFHMEKVQKALQEAREHIATFQIPTELWPSCVLDANDRREYQVVAYRTSTHSMKVGIVEEVIRGAAVKLAKAKAKARALKQTTRMMRVTRPVTFALRSLAAARIKVVELTVDDATPSHWSTSAIAIPTLLDPLDKLCGVCGEFSVLAVVSEWPKLILRLNDNVPEVLLDLEEPLSALGHKACVILLNIISDSGGQHTFHHVSLWAVCAFGVRAGFVFGSRVYFDVSPALL